MGVLLLTGSLLAGPPQGSETFPGGTVSVPISSVSKNYAVASGIIARSVASPGAYIALQGVGSTDTVTKGLFVYFKTDADVLLRVTTDDGLGAPVVQSDVPVGGLWIRDLPQTKFLRLLEIKGTAQVEYFICGQE